MLKLLSKTQEYSSIHLYTKQTQNSEMIYFIYFQYQSSKVSHEDERC